MSLFLVDHFVGDVADTIGDFFKTLVVEVHFYVAALFLHYWFDSEKSIAETYRRHNAKVFRLQTNVIDCFYYLLFYFRLVYKWFLLLYKLSYILGIIGYIIMMAAFFGLNLVFDAKVTTWMDLGLLIIFYGLYYGVLGRDVSEICADKMASHIGVSFFLLHKFKINKYFKSIAVLYKRRNAY